MFDLMDIDYYEICLLFVPRVGNAPTLILRLLDPFRLLYPACFPWRVAVCCRLSPVYSLHRGIPFRWLDIVCLLGVLQTVNEEAHVFLCVGTCDVVVLEVILRACEVAAVCLIVQDEVIPQVRQFPACRKLSPVVAVLLCETFDDGWPSVVDGFVNCVVHNVCCV